MVVAPVKPKHITDEEGFQQVNSRNKCKVHEGFTVGQGKPKVIYMPVLKSTNEKGSSSSTVAPSTNQYVSLINLDDDNVSKEKLEDASGKDVIQEKTNTKKVSNLEKLFNNSCGLANKGSDSSMEPRVPRVVESDTDSEKTTEYAEGASTPDDNGLDV